MRLLQRLFSFIIKNKRITTAVLILSAAGIPFLGLSPYIMRIIILGGIYMILALSLNLLTGFTGQVSLGHAAFYGIGAYTSALLVMRANVPFVFSAIAGGLLAAAFGILLGIPTLKLQGSYLSIVTLGFGEITRIVELNWLDLTRGPMGLPGIPSPDIFDWVIDKDIEYFYLILFLVLVTIAVIKSTINSRTGRALVSIREDELAAEAMGINILNFKILAFAVSAFFAGIAGSFYAHYVTFIDPQSFTFDESIQILSMVILGGMGSIPGSIIGAAVLVAIPEFLRDLQQYRMLIYGLLLAVIMVVRPQGILGNVRFKNIINKISGAEKEVTDSAQA